MPINNNERVLPTVEATLTPLNFRVKKTKEKDGTIFGWEVYRVHSGKLASWLHKWDKPVAFISMEDSDDFQVSRYPDSPADIENMIKVLFAAIQKFDPNIKVEAVFWKKEKRGIW